MRTLAILHLQKLLEVVAVEADVLLCFFANCLLDIAEVRGVVENFLAVAESLGLLQAAI